MRKTFKAGTFLIAILLVVLTGVYAVFESENLNMRSRVIFNLERGIDIFISASVSGGNMDERQRGYRGLTSDIDYDGVWDTGEIQFLEEDGSCGIVYLFNFANVGDEDVLITLNFTGSSGPEIFRLTGGLSDGGEIPLYEGDHVLLPPGEEAIFMYAFVIIDMRYNLILEEIGFTVNMSLHE